MDDLFTYLLMLLFGSLALVVGLTAWFCAAAVWQMTPQPLPPAEGGTRTGLWYRFLGWSLMWIGALGLFALAVGSGTSAVVEQQLVTRAPVALFVTLTALVTLIAVIQASSGLRRLLVQEAELQTREAWEHATPGERWRRWLPTPLGLLSACLGVTAIVTILAEIGILTIGLGNTEEHFSIALLLLALVGQGVTFIGLILATAAELLTLPWETIDTRRRRLISRLLMVIGVSSVLIVALPLLVPGLLLILLLTAIFVSVLAGQRRAAGLSAFWTFSHAVKTRQPLEPELRAQAELARGRASYLLGSVTQDLSQ
jgi:hypothetical protein